MPQYLRHIFFKTIYDIERRRIEYMEIFLKYVVVLLITIALQLLFSVFFHFGIKQVFEGYSEESANQTYLLLKYIGFALIAGFFTLLLLWNYIGFIYLAWYHKLAMAFMFFYFWIYCYY